MVKTSQVGGRGFWIKTSRRGGGSRERFESNLLGVGREAMDSLDRRVLEFELNLPSELGETM